MLAWSAATGAMARVSLMARPAPSAMDRATCSVTYVRGTVDAIDAMAPVLSSSLTCCTAMEFHHIT